MAVPQNSFVVYIGAVSNRRAFMKPYSLFGQAVGVLQKEGVVQATSAHFDEDNPQMPITIKALGAVADDLMQLYSTVGFGTVRITNAELRFARPNTKEQKYLLVFPNVREHHEIEETPIPFIQTTDATVFEPLNPTIVDIKAEYARAVFRHALANSNYDQNISEVLEREPGSEFNGYGIVERAYINQVTKSLISKGYWVVAAPEAARGPLNSYKSIMKSLTWLHPQFYNNGPNSVAATRWVPPYRSKPKVWYATPPGNWQDPTPAKFNV
eukprot:509191_1